MLQATYTYDANGNRTSLTCSNGVTTTYTYNAANWVTSLQNTRNGETLSGFTYTYYASGSQKSKTDISGTVTTYMYDGLNRLVQESETGGQTVDYTYDANGNRAQMVVTGTEAFTTDYPYDANNRLLTETEMVDGKQHVTTYTYDANGNTLQVYTPSGCIVYSYDAFNQLCFTSTNEASVVYAYNAQGLRIAKATTSGITQFLLDGDNVAAEVVNDQLSATYLRGANLISRNEEYYLFNAHGDVVNLTSTGGVVTKSYAYDAFGNERNPDEADDNPFRNCGEYFDSERGTYYLRARYYDPAIGRFTQADTHWSVANMIYGDTPRKINEREDALGLKTYTYAPQITAIMQSGNLYVYGANNPVMFADRNGNIAFMVFTALAGVVIGGVVGAVQSHNKYGEVRWENVVIGVGVGGTLGLLGGAAVGLAFAGSATASASIQLFPHFLIIPHAF